MRAHTSICYLTAATVIACGPHEPSEQALAEIARLDSVRAELASAIEEARETEADWEGGLLAVLAAARRELLETTDGMLGQRIEALRAGSKLDHTLRFPMADTNRASALAAEIKQRELELATAMGEANAYQGGLLQAMALLQVATLNQTLAMLDQQRLAALYGLPIPVVDMSDTVSLPSASAPASPAPATARVRPAAQSEPPSQPRFEIVDVDSRVTEQNQVFWRYAWRLTLKNLSDRTLRLNATIEFQDADGFVVDEDTEYGLILAAGEENTFTGYALVNADIAVNVARINAKVGSSF